MISFVVKDKPKHPIVKALRENYGDKYNEWELVFMPMTSPSCGWCIDGFFIGYTIKSSVERLKKKEWGCL